jgi:hypothetical protein
MNNFQFKESYKAPSLVTYNQIGMLIPQQTVDDGIGKGILELFDATLSSKLQHKHEHLFYRDFMHSKLRLLNVDCPKKEKCSCGEKSKLLLYISNLFYFLERMKSQQPTQFQASHFYGVIHLFRLVYRLPELLPSLRVSPDATELIYSYVFRLVEFILKNKE